MRGAFGLLAMACVGLAAASWAAQCEDSASTCAASIDAHPAAAPPDVRALLEAHSRSRKALAAQRPIKQQPRLREVHSRIEPGRRPDFLPQIPHTQTKRRRPPTISPFAPLGVHVECDLDGFATKSGQALSDHIRAMTYGCVNALLDDAPLELRLAALRMQHMIDVAQATIGVMETYEGANTGHLYSKHYLFLRSGYYNHAGHADAMDWGDDYNLAVVTEAVAEAADAFIENSHFLDHTETHSETAWEVYAMLDGPYFLAYLAGYLPAFKSWIKAFGGDHFELYEVISATNVMFSIFDQGHYAPGFVAAATSDLDLVATLRSFALSDDMLDTTAEVLLGNAGYHLAQFLQYESAPIYTETVDAVRSILGHYDRSSRDEVGVWLETARIASYHGKCAEFQICGFEQELEREVLSVSHACSAIDVRIRAENLTGEDLAIACDSMADIEARFHELLNTGRQPVADDHNAHLEVVVYANWDSYDTYSGLFFGNDTDNGGIYLEGDPADPSNLARFFAYVADWLPERRVWNLEHEYVHYLDGRFNIYGGFSLDYDALWWAEGLAEYIDKQNENEDAIELAPSADFLLNELFSTTYDDGTEQVYRWGYLAVRFMFERHPEHVGRIASYLRAGCFAEHDRYLERTIGAAHNDEWLKWLDSVSTTSEFVTDRGVEWLQVDCGVGAGPSTHVRHVRHVDIWPLGESTVVDVSTFFEGLGADAVFSVSSSDPAIVNATLHGNALTLVAVSEGQAVVSVVASEGGVSATRTVLVEAAGECPPFVCRSFINNWRVHLLTDSQ